MRPNTPHAVFTLDHSICHGGYFYATSTMQDTEIGLMHTFIGNSLIANVAHLPTRAILRRMALFYHKSLILHGRKSMTASACSNFVGFEFSLLKNPFWDDRYGCTSSRPQQPRVPLRSSVTFHSCHYPQCFGLSNLRVF